MGLRGWHHRSVSTAQPPTFGARLVDLTLAVLILAMGASWATGAWDQHNSALPVAGVALGVAAILLTGWRRRTDPVPVYTALILTAIALEWLSGRGSGSLAVLLALFVAQAYEERVPLRRGLVAAALLLVSVEALSADRWEARIESVAVALAVLGWAQGTRVSRLYREGLLARAADAERERDLRAAQAVAAERTRIARDIHDIVSHSLAVVVVQASGAERVADKRPELAREALGVIAQTARGALTEMRALLQVLREGDVPTQGDAPSPGLAQIEDLAAELSARGMQVRMVTRGTACSLGAGAELALFRVAQESLTNAVKHGDRSAPTELSLEYRSQEVILEVVNPIRHGSGGDDDHVPGSGSGQAGMRERLALYGGTLVAGPDEGHYRVRATVPRPAGSAGAAGSAAGDEAGEGQA